MLSDFPHFSTLNYYKTFEFKVYPRRKHPNVENLWPPLILSNEVWIKIPLDSNRGGRRWLKCTNKMLHKVIGSPPPLFSNKPHPFQFFFSKISCVWNNAFGKLNVENDPRKTKALKFCLNCNSSTVAALKCTFHHPITPSQTVVKCLCELGTHSIWFYGSRSFYATSPGMLNGMAVYLMNWF